MKLFVLFLLCVLCLCKFDTLENQEDNCFGNSDCSETKFCRWIVGLCYNVPDAYTTSSSFMNPVRDEDITFASSANHPCKSSATLATAALIEISWAYIMGPPSLIRELSPEMMLLCLKNDGIITNMCDDSMSVRDGLIFSAEKGLCSIDQYSSQLFGSCYYSRPHISIETDGSVETGCSNWNYTSDGSHCVSRVSELLQTEFQVEKLLNTYGALAFDNLDRDCFINYNGIDVADDLTYTGEIPNARRHAAVLIGYTETEWIFLNSMGSTNPEVRIKRGDNYCGVHESEYFWVKFPTPECIFDLHCAADEYCRKTGDEFRLWTLDYQEPYQCHKIDPYCASNSDCKYVNAIMNYDYTKYCDLKINRCRDVPDQLNWDSLGVVNPVKDQGSCGSCFAHASASMVESQWAVYSGILPQPLSINQALDCEPENTCSGGTIINVLDQVLSANGYASNSHYGSPGFCDCKSSSCVNKIVVKFDSYFRSSFSKDEELIQNINSFGPLGMMDFNGDCASIGGTIELYQYAGPTYDTTDNKHSVLVIGYTPSYWIIRNSHGPGVNADIWVARDQTSVTGVCNMKKGYYYNVFFSENTVECYNDDMCPSNLYCKYLRAREEDWTFDGDNVYSCQQKFPSLSTCDRDRQCTIGKCNPFTNKCAECLSDDVCASDEFCPWKYDFYQWPVSKYLLCTSKENLNGWCGETRHCSEGLTCNAWAQCSECLDDNGCLQGEFCAYYSQWNWESELNSCKQKVVGGSWCGRNAHCENGFCKSNGICAECLSDNDCSSGEYCSTGSSWPVNLKYTCRTKTNTGQWCNRNEHCLSSKCDTVHTNACADCLYDGECTTSQFCANYANALYTGYVWTSQEINRCRARVPSGWWCGSHSHCTSTVCGYVWYLLGWRCW